MNKLATLGIVLATAACTPKKATTTPVSTAGGAVGSTAGGAVGAATNASCGCLAVAGEVAANVMADVAKADLLYVRGDFRGALDLYVRAHGVSKDAALLYAQGMVQWQLGANAEAKALLAQYISAGGTFKARAEAAVRDIDAGVSAAVGAAVGGVAGVGGTVGGAVGGVGGVVGGVAAKPKRIAGTAGIVLGVVAVGAIAAVGIHSISAGFSEDISLDPKFDLGLGLTGVVVGVTAVYVYGLTAASASVAAACATRVAEGKPVVAPMAVNGGGGVTAVMSF